jgi:hypothetical protein
VRKGETPVPWTPGDIAVGIAIARGARRKSASVSIIPKVVELKGYRS